MYRVYALFARCAALLCRFDARRSENAPFRPPIKHEMDEK